nr:immunoglobulin heavy chain junction region [Mus musculus]
CARIYYYGSEDYAMDYW